jgi:hypothetical protein
MTNEFLVSVADVILRDPTTKAGLAYGKANISSAFTLSMQSADVRAGINNPLLYSYYHTRELSVKVEQATFDETILSLNVGSTVAVGAVNVLQTDCLTTSASSCAQTTLTPVGDVSVFLSDGTIQTVTPSNKNIVLSGAVSQTVIAIYTTSKSANQITVGSTTPPSIVDLTLIAEIRASDQTTVKKYLQINVPRFQVAGNYTLNLAANGVSNQALEGKALVSVAADCSSGDYYAKVSYIPVSDSFVYSQIAALPSTISWTKSTVQTSQISVLGIRGGNFANENITTDCTYARSGSSGSGITVGASTGLISTSASSTTIVETVRINVTYPSGSLVDYVNINIS